MQELKLLLLNITYERKLDCRITDKEALDAHRIIIPFLGGINEKFHVISFIVVKTKKPCQLSWWLFISCDEVILEVIVLFWGENPEKESHVKILPCEKVS